MNTIPNRQGRTSRLASHPSPYESLCVVPLPWTPSRDDYLTTNSPGGTVETLVEGNNPRMSATPSSPCLPHRFVLIFLASKSPGP